MECIDAGCDRTAKSRGLCNMHYLRWWAEHRRAAPDRRINGKNGAECVTEGCDKPPKAHGHCHSCYLRLRRRGTTDYAVRSRKPCSVLGCERTKRARGLCEMHSRRQANHGTTDLRPWAFKPCSVSDCGEPVHDRGKRLCAMHYKAHWKYGFGPGDFHAYWQSRGGLCDLCGLPVSDPRLNRRQVKDAPHVDHDHDHCDRKYGCRECIRGLLHSRCNTVEGEIMKGLRYGIVTAVQGRLTTYWADPPFQRWLRERDATEDTPLAA